MSSTYHGQDEQKRATDDGDSGFHELMDDPAAFELLSFDGRSSPSQAQLQRMQRNVGSFPASDSSNTTPEYSPVSPSPRIVGNESVSSTNTQPDGGMSPAAGVEPEESNLDRTGTNLFSTSPAASEEDVSEKGKLYRVVVWLKGHRLVASRQEEQTLVSTYLVVTWVFTH